MERPLGCFLEAREASFASELPDSVEAVRGGHRDGVIELNM